MGVAKVLEGKRGRPRLEATDQAIYAAAAQLIEERGYDGFSMAAVAGRAGVAKTTVYRRWPSRSHLVLAAISSAMAGVKLLHTGDPRADLVGFVRSLASALRAPGIRRLMAELVLAAAQSPDLAATIGQVFAQRRAASIPTMERILATAELCPGVEPALLLDQLIGPLYYRLLISGEPLSDAHAVRLANAVLRGALAEGQGG